MKRYDKRRYAPLSEVTMKSYNEKSLLKHGGTKPGCERLLEKNQNYEKLQHERSVGGSLRLQALGKQAVKFRGS